MTSLAPALLRTFCLFSAMMALPAFSQSSRYALEMTGEKEIIVECGMEIPYSAPLPQSLCKTVPVDHLDYSVLSPWYYYVGSPDRSVAVLSRDLDGLVIGSRVGGTSFDISLVTVAVAKPVTMSFDWRYTADPENLKSVEKFGYRIGDTFYPLTSGAVQKDHCGHESITIPQASEFSFEIVFEGEVPGSRASISNMLIKDQPLECPVVDCVLRQFTAKDECLNSAVFNQFIITRDTTEPWIEPYISEIQVFEQEFNSVPGLLAGDECSATNMMVSENTIAGNQGQNVIRDFVITDRCGNTTHAQQVITILTFPESTRAKKD